MTLRKWDKIPLETNPKVGVEHADRNPMPNPWIRQKILQRVLYWLKGTEERASKYAYQSAFNHLENYAFPLSEIRMELNSLLAETKIKQKESKYESNTTENYNYYSNERKAFENVLELIEEKIPEDEQERIFTTG